MYVFQTVLILALNFHILISTAVEEFEDLGIKIGHGYDKAIPPSRPVGVSLKIIVNNVAPIQSSEMEFRTQMTWSLSWKEPRIMIDLDEDCELNGPSYIIAPGTLAKRIWSPDLYIVNAKYTGLRKLDYLWTIVKLFPDGKVVQTILFNATVACDMNFEFYPMDAHLCPLQIRSFSYPASELTLIWQSDPNEFVIAPMRLIQFMVVEPPKTGRKHIFVPHQGNATQLTATFRFERMMSSHLVQSFIPTCILVALSWFSFWMELEVTSARGYLLMALTLSLEIHLSGFKTDFPPVAYIKAVDIWIFGCLFWVFCALAEFVLVKVIYSMTEAEKRKNQVVKLQHLDRRDILAGSEETPENGDADVISHYWMWQELLDSRKKMQELSAGDGSDIYLSSYKKRRLGSVVLSGRSVATSYLPLTQSQLFGRTISLVWEGPDCRKVLWREIDNWAKIIFPASFSIFAFMYLIVLYTHSTLV